jgi:predicted AAA+ superfamily ATPase
MSELQTSEREINALVKLHAFEPLQRALIITRDDEYTFQKDNGLTIEVKPIWKWLLE